MIVTSLPPPPAHTHSRHASEAAGLAQLPAPPAVKSAWQRSRHAAPSLEASPGSQTVLNRVQRGGILPNESFVMLQDSVINSIPSHALSPPQLKPGSHNPHSTISPRQSGNRPEPESDIPSPLSHHLRSNMRLFNILATRTDIDHPLCAECTQILLTSLQRQLDETKKERDGYIAFEKEVKKEKERSNQSLSTEDVMKKIEKLKVEERAAIEQLKEAERERQQLDEELKALEIGERSLELEEAE